MAGLGVLVKLLRKSFLPSVEDTGLLPGRYYLNFALDALKDDDIDEAVRCVELARDRGGPRWRLVAQQVVFRIRVLKDRHHRELEWLEHRIPATREEETGERLRRIARAEKKAIEILSGLEQRVLKRLKAKENTRP